MTTFDLRKGVTASGRNQEVFGHSPELSFALSLTFLYASLTSSLTQLLTKASSDFAGGRGQVV